MMGAINLLRGMSAEGLSVLPVEPDHRAMEEYLNNLLAAGIIRLTSSLAGAGFLYIKKKVLEMRSLIFCPRGDKEGEESIYLEKNSWQYEGIFFKHFHWH